jgi:hypothetical protein
MPPIWRLVLGAIIDEDQTLCPASPGELVTALATDLANGAFLGGLTPDKVGRVPGVAESFLMGVAVLGDNRGEALGVL